MVCFLAKKDRYMCFEEASRIGIKISFIKIAGVFDRGEITVAILAVRINKRHAAGMELITFIMKKLCSRLSCTLSTENKSQILQKP